MPYKLERLKPIYLLIIFTIFFSLSFTVEKSIFSLITTSKYKEEYTIIEKNPVGDEGPIDINETMDYPFEIVWDDKDYESNRPNSVTYNLYNVLDENTIVSTVTLTSSNVDSNDFNKWLGTFNNIPKYNQDESKAKYIIKQDTINNYVQKYDLKQYDGLCIEFGDNVNTSVSDGINIYYYDKGEEKYYFYIDENDSYSLNREYLKNNTLCISVKMDNPEIYFYREFDLDIKKIYPVYNNQYRSIERNWSSYNHYTTFYGSYYPDTVSSYGANPSHKYIWEANKNNFDNANIIINEINLINYDFTHYVNNGGSFSKLKNITYKLYQGDNEILSKTVDNIFDKIDDENKYIDSFTNLVKYDSNQKEIEYKIEVVLDDNSYNTTYDVDFEYNGICVEFGDSISNVDMFFLSKYNDGKYYIALDTVTKRYQTWYYKNQIKNNKICSTTTMDSHDIYIHYPGRIIYKNIYPTYQKYYSLPEYGSNSYSGIEYEGNDLPYSIHDYSSDVHYTWKPNNRTFPKSNKFETSQDTIDIKFDKYWEDEGYEELRPNNSEFYLYRKDNQNDLIEKITLSSENLDPEDNYHWTGVFKNKPVYDVNGNKIEYVVREKEIPNYINSYDSKDGLAVTFNERTKFGSDYAFEIYYYDNTSNKLYKYKDSNSHSSSYTMNDDLGGKTIYINLPVDEQHYVESPLSNVIRPTHNYPSVLEYVNNMFPESYHNTATYVDYATYHYRHSISEKTANLYFVYSGSSWGNQYGLKIDDITTIGNETIITSTINFKDLVITKKWEDEGFESERPSSTIVDIYDNNDMNTIMKTVELNNSDIIDEYTWKKTVSGLKKYDNNLQEIEYTIVERNIDKYLTRYDFDEYYNGLAVTFDENQDANNLYLGFMKTYYNEKARIISNSCFSYNYCSTYHLQEEDFLSGRTVYIASRNMYLVLRNASRLKLKVVDIIPYHVEESLKYYNDRIDVEEAKTIGSTTFNNYPDYEIDNISFYSNYMVEYIWNGSLVPKKNATIIINRYNRKEYSFKKTWNDIGMENLRPSSIEFDLYNLLDENEVVQSVTLTENNKNINNSYEWNGVFKNIPIYNNDGSLAEYIVKEKTSSDYLLKYDVDNKNGYCIEFNKTTSNDYVYILVKNNNAYKFVSSKYSNDYYSRYFYPSQMFTDTICFETDANDFYFYESKPLIKNIYPIYKDNYDFIVSSIDGYYYSGDEETISGMDFLNLSDTYHYVHYIWNESIDIIKNNNEIINEATTKNIVVKKEWNDIGYEDNRPESVKFNIYNALYEDTVISTITLTSENENPNNPNEWNGVFKNILKYNEDGTTAHYIVKEDKLDKYKTKYDIDNLNGFCVKFNNNNYHDYIYFMIKQGSVYKKISYKGSLENGINFYPNNMSNKEVCFQTNTRDFYLYEGKQYIDDIYPVYKEKYDYVIGYGNGYYNDYDGIEKTGREYEDLEQNKYYYIHYTLNVDDEPVVNANVVTNYANMRDDTYTKEFNDEGLEYNRPSEIVFGLYVENDPIPKEMTTLNTSTCENNTCTIEFKNVKDKDSNGNSIEYEIREISDYGYTVTYNGNTITNTANPVDVKFIKVNNEGKAIRGAKLSIYNKSGDKLKEFTSSNKELTIKLLPSEYTIKELEPPEGYERVEDIHIVVNKDGTYTQDGNTVETIRIVNEPIKETYNINLKKTLKTNEEKEFEFEINIIGYEGTLEYDGDKTGTLTFTDGKAIVKLGCNQSITIKNIPVNSKYEIREIGNDYLVTIVGETNGILNRNETIEFINVPRSVPGNGDIVIPEEKEVPTPITGVFNILSYIAGILLLIGSIFLIVYFKKQINKKEI